jgi:hypothetical protein
MRAPFLFASLLLFGCGADPQHAEESASAPPENASVVIEANDELDTQRTEALAQETLTQESPVVTRGPLVLSALSNIDAEDGAHHTAPAGHAVAFDIDGRLVPARALDPVLHVGQLTLHAYRFPRPGIMRFVLDHARLPEDGVEVYVQFGDDFAQRVQLGTLDAHEVR